MCGRSQMSARPDMRAYPSLRPLARAVLDLIAGCPCGPGPFDSHHGEGAVCHRRKHRSVHSVGSDCSRQRAVSGRPLSHYLVNIPCHVCVGFRIHIGNGTVAGDSLDQSGVAVDLVACRPGDLFPGQLNAGRLVGRCQRRSDCREHFDRGS